MRRSLIFVFFVSLIAACVTIEPPPDPRGAIKPNQRLIVMVQQSPGPWIVADPDSKAETAIKLMPLGNFLQGMQEDRINSLSKEIQPYLPRPHYAQAVETALIRALKAAHGGPVQTAAEAGISPLQVRNWNDASDQLDWRRKYYFTDPDRPSPRDYSRILSLDDAVVLEVNLSFGLEPDETERTLPLLSAAVRAHRADTARMLWSREERLSDITSSTTLSEFRAVPTELTDRLYALSVPLGQKIAADFARDAGLLPPPPPVAVDAPPPAVYLNGSAPDISTAPLTELPPSMPEVAASTETASPVEPAAPETALPGD